MVYHGTRRKDAQQPFNRNYDIVITAYETLHHDSKTDKKLRDENRYRVVLDEGEVSPNPTLPRTPLIVEVLDPAHRIQNRACAQFEAAAALKCHYPSCLTGTSIQNSLDDYGALLAFLQVETFRHKQLFDSLIAGPMERKMAKGVHRLKLLVAATCLLRTKNTVEDAVGLRDKKEVVGPIQLAATEREIYEFFQRKASKLTIQVDPSEPCERKYNTLSMITNMRLICNHREDRLPLSGFTVQ